MAPPFEEDDPSDPDSISLTSTREPSDAEAEWAVEKVLAECVDKDSGETKYLIKWEGYPLHDCSWEPAENLKSPSILLEWRIDQQAVADGVKQPFDLDDFFEAWEINAEAREGRKARRKAKRRRLGIPSRSASVDVDSADDDDDDDDVEMEDAPEDGEVSSPARSKKVRTPLPKRKGVAQTVKRSLNRRNVAASSSEDSSGGEDDGGSTSEDSLLEEARKSASKRPSQKASGSRANDVTSFTAVATSKITRNKSPTKTTRPVGSKPSATDAANPPKTAVRTGARKSAPSTGSTTAQPSGQPRTQATGAAPQRKAAASPSPPPRRQPAPNIMRNFARPPPDPRQRVRSGNDPRELRFGSLSEQNRFHKHAAREKAPDPSLLATFNPATGRMVAPPAAMEKAPDPSRFDPVAGRLDVPSAAATTSSEPIRDATHRTAERSMLPPPAPPVAPMGSAMRSTSPTKTAQPPQPPVPPAQNPSLNSGPSAPAPVAATAPRVARPTAAPSVFGRREAPAPERHRSASPPSSPGQRRLMSTDSYGHRRDREKSITCRDWAKGECLKSDGDCWFAHFYVRKYTCGWWRIGNCKYSAKDCIGGHYDTGNELTCPFWLDGHCSKPKALCHYAHYDTGMRAPKPGGHRGPVPTMGSNGPVVQHDEARTVLTCPFWLDGGCFRSEADCKYAHYDTGLRATKRGEKGGPVPTGLNNPNHQPLPADKPRFQHSPLHQPHFQQSPAHHSPVQQSPRSPAMSPGHDADGGSPVFNDGPGPNMMASSDKMNPVAARGPLSVQRPSGPPAFTHSVALKITCGTELDVSAKLACAVKEDLIQLSSVMHSQARLELQRSVNASDLQHQLADVLEQGAQYPCGEVIFDSHNDKLKKLVEALKQEVCCGTVLDDRFTLLVYPAGTEDWKFFNRDGDVTSSQAALKFKLLPPLPDVAQSMSSSVAPNLSGLKTSPSELLVARLEGIDVDRMVMHSETKQEVRAFIMMPPSRAMEMDLIAEVIKSRIDPKQVKTSRDPGAWADLIASGRGSCLVILHPDIPLWSIHHLGTALHFRIFRIFSVGVNPGLATLERREPRFESQRLFETGDVVFISDYVFLNDPMKALELIKEVCRMNSIKPSGALRSKVAARPGVRLWLMNLAIERTGDRGREDIHWIQLLEAVCKLCPPELEDKLYPGNPSDKADLVSAAPESVPSFQVALEVDPGKALDFAVHWFAGWAYMNAASFRRFAVCHEVEGTGEQVFDEHGRIVKRNVQADPSGWGEEYKYLIVRTPDQWLNDVRERQSKNQTLRMGP